MYKVSIKCSNKVFIINHRQIRSPFECTVDEKQLKLIQFKIKSYGILEKDYEIQNLDVKLSDTKNDFSYIPPSNRQPDRKDRTKKQSTNNHEIKIKDNVKKISVKKIDSQEVTKSLFTENTKNIEQNINEEVKVEELSTESSSILDRLLINNKI